MSPATWWLPLPPSGPPRTVADYDIPDPYRRDDAAYELAATLVYDACDRIAKALDG